MKLALFDLDHTLLPVDSDYLWGQFLIDIGVLDKTQHQQQNDVFFEQYKNQTLDIYAYLGFQLKPLADHPREQLERWRRQFMHEVIEPQIRSAALGLVRSHLQKDTLCAVVTATNSFITRPIVDRFSVPALIATEPEEVNGKFTGKPYGIPCFREGKISRVEQWLKLMKREWRDFESVHFYSDSANDLPLLEHVTHPVATNPDETLMDIAKSRGWAIIRLFE